MACASYDATMRLRLYHHPDGARVAYRELGAGPPLALLHSALLSHKEWEPAAGQLADRFRVVLPDLPLHGDSEDRPRHPYTLDWFAEVLGGFAAEVLGPRPLIAGHDAGAEILLHAVCTGRLPPARLVLMGNRMHAPPERRLLRAGLAAGTRSGASPAWSALLSYGTRAVFTPERGLRLSARANPAASRPLASCLRRRPRQLEPRPLLGEVRAQLAARRADAAARPLPRAGHARAAAVGRPGSAGIRSPPPKRRWRCCPTASCACSRAPAS